MKKFGFTLAEVLITLGIIGVIAAITLPTLMTDTTTAQIGPKLAKAVAMFEQANETLLNENSVDSLTDAGLLSNAADYSNSLSNHLKGSIDASGFFLAKDGVQYRFSIDIDNEAGGPAHNQRVGNVVININPSSARDINGTNLFHFSWWNDGSLRPKGATNWGDGNSWRNQCPVAPAAVADYTFCAGHIFENNLKVLYN